MRTINPQKAFRIFGLCFLLMKTSSFIVHAQIIYYPIHGNIKDESGNGLDGTAHGTTFTTDRFNNPNEALYFHGEDAYVDIPQSWLIQSSFPKTVSLWVYFDDLDYYYSIFSSDYDENAYTGYWIGLAEKNGNKVISCSYGDGGLVGDPAARISAIGTTPLISKKWYHVTAIFKDLEDMEIYLDCKPEIIIYNGTGAGLSYSNQPGSLGRHNSSNHVVPPSVYYLHGKIDEFKIFNQALSGSDITDLCNTENFFSQFSYEGTCKNQSYKFQYSGGINYDSIVWNFGDTNSDQNISRITQPMHLFTDTGNYKVTLRVYYKNVLAESYDNIKVKDCKDEIIIPNVITPNSDSSNDYWIITNIELYPDSYLVVFNRWGTRVFTSTPSLKKWDGLYNGEKVSPGCYYYIIVLNNGTQAFTGPLMVYW
jgi:gliding motility-associated-like protein